MQHTHRYLITCSSFLSLLFFVVVLNVLRVDIFLFRISKLQSLLSRDSVFVPCRLYTQYCSSILVVDLGGLLSDVGDVLTVGRNLGLSEHINLLHAFE